MSFEREKNVPEKEASFEGALSLESRLKTVDDAEQLARTHLQELGWDDSEVEDFAFSVREAVANAVVHGNLGIFKNGPDDPEINDRILAAENTEKADKKVNIIFHFTSDRAEAEIVDEGNFLPEHIPDSEFKEGDMATNGRGFKLIGFRMDEIHFSPGGIRFVLERKGKDHL